MNFILVPLAVAGIAAVLARVARAGFRLLTRGVNGYLAGELASNRARRGDLTGAQDAEVARRQATGLRRRSAVEVAVWLGLLAAPMLTPWPTAVFAAYAGLWLLPRGRR